MPLIYLMRHGPAETAGDDPGLSGPGERLIQEAARGLRALGISPAAVHSSPLRRAMQTAAIVAEASGAAGEWSVIPEAAPGARLGRLAGRLAATGAAGEVLVVGHQPDVGLMAMEAIGARLPPAFGKGTVCGVELASWDDPGAGRPGQLRLFLTAEMLARAGRG